MFVAETITNEAGFARLAPEWAALDAKLSPRTPFSSPLWCETWWRHFARNNFFARDQMRVFAVRDGDRLTGVAPMMLTCRPSVGPVKVRELQFFGADANMTELRGPVCCAQDIDAVTTALDAHLKTYSSDWDWIQWHGLRQREIACVGPSTLPLRNYTELTNLYLILPDSWEVFRASLSRNIKESLRKCYNSLARDGHAFTFRVVAVAEEAEAALRCFLDLHRRRALANGMIEHGDVFAKPNTRRFLLEYGCALAISGKLIVFQMEISGNIVASRIGVVLNDELYLYYSGYDPAWGRYSVMTTVVAEAIRWSIENGFRVVNLSNGVDVSKMRWRPQQVVFIGGYQIPPRPWPQKAFASMEMLRKYRI